MECRTTVSFRASVSIPLQCQCQWKCGKTFRHSDSKDSSDQMLWGKLSRVKPSAKSPSKKNVAAECDHVQRTVSANAREKDKNTMLKKCGEMV